MPSYGGGGEGGGDGTGGWGSGGGYGGFNGGTSTGGTGNSWADASGWVNSDPVSGDVSWGGGPDGEGSFSYGADPSANMFDLSSMYSSPMANPDVNPTDMRLAAGTQATPSEAPSGWGDRAKRLAMAAGMYAIRGTPLGQLAGLAQLGYSAYQGNPVGASIGSMLGGLPGAMAGMGVDAARGANVGPQAGAMAGSTIGNAISPGLGGLVGGMLGSEAAQGLANRSSAPSEGGFNMNGALQGLGGLYSAYQGDKAANQNLQTLQQVQQSMPSLDSLYGPNSAAYRRMKAELASKDAAGGRRSQYGARAAELESKMAGMMGQYGPGMMNAQNSNLQQQQAAIANQNAARNQKLNALGSFFKSSGLGQEAADSLQGLWNRNVTPVDMTGFNIPQTPSWQGSPVETPWQPMNTAVGADTYADPWGGW